MPVESDFHFASLILPDTGPSGLSGPWLPKPTINPVLIPPEKGEPIPFLVRPLGFFAKGQVNSQIPVIYPKVGVFWR